MHETLVHLVSTVKILLEKNQPIIPGGGTDDSSVNPAKTNGGRRRKHYENRPMQYTEKKLVVKMKIFTGKILIFFLFLLKT